MSKMDKRSFGDDLLNGGDLTNLMADAGIDLDSRLWFIKLRFTNGVVRTFEVSASEQLRMRDSMFGSSQFFVFDSGDARLAINLHHVEYSHWLFEGPSTLVVNSAGANDSETARVGPDPSDAVIVMLGSNAEPLLFRVEADVPEDPKEEVGMGQMENLLYTAEQLEVEDERRFHFEDEDGEEVFLLRSAVSLISIPLWVIEPSLVEARREGFDEDTAAAV
jgi:hypothetical protein